VIRAADPRRRIPFVIRIDDVACKEPTFCWLLELLAARGMRATLEVVPYLLEFDEEFLDRFDPSNALFEVSQHGYAHVPNASQSGRPYEFSPESAAPSARELEVIAQGRRLVEAAFPRRFTGGFSAPFDELPRWLPEVWQTLGGTFVSSLLTNSAVVTNSAPDAVMPVTRAGMDVWDWSSARAFTRSQVKRELARQIAADGHAGIVLHPCCFRQQMDKSLLVNLLNYVEGLGVMPVSLRDCALGKVEKPNPQSQNLGNRLRAWLTRKRAGMSL
jgi:hypothetical protein